jgi:hypothetical protein
MTSRSWLHAVFVAIVCAAAPATAADLFAGDEILDLRLRGPLGTLIANPEVRENYPFELEVDGRSTAVDVRARGNSRILFCEFPPLRLSFDAPNAEPIFAGQDKLKLVTHCHQGSERSENDVLDEYTAYRIFNAITPRSYRVRLVRILYEDTTGELDGLGQTHYGFLIESDDELARRMGAEAARLPGAPYTQLDAVQVARMFVFQYLIGNLDYSLVTAEHDEFCCHNLDVFQGEDRLYPVPYDFDLSGLVNAVYAKPNPDFGQRRVTQRRYVGYCSSDIATIGEALDHIIGLKEDILAVLASVPAVSQRAGKDRQRYVEDFFKAASKPQKLLKQFGRDCIGRDYGRPVR